MNKLSSCCLVVFGLCFANLAHANSYDLSFFSGPTGFRLLDATGINSQGDIAGWGFNDIGGPDGLFRSSGGSISTFGVPNAALTQVNAINNSGKTVGDYYDASGIHAFLCEPDGTIQTLQIPYASFGFSAPYFESARATGINDSGQIIGTFQAGETNGSVFNGSFLEQPDGTFVLIAPTNGTYLTAISNNGYILGRGLTPFVMDASLQIVRTISTVPSAYGYGPATLTSINSNGDIIGSYNSAYGAFITNVFSDVYTSLPSPQYCTAGAINDSGVITGTCQSSYQAFVLSPIPAPVPEPASIYMLLCSLLLGAIVKCRLSTPASFGCRPKVTR
jgi:hypothetical protein